MYSLFSSPSFQREARGSVTFKIVPSYRSAPPPCEVIIIEDDNSTNFYCCCCSCFVCYYLYLFWFPFCLFCIITVCSSLVVIVNYLRCFSLCVCGFVLTYMRVCMDVMMNENVWLKIYMRKKAKRFFNNATISLLGHARLMWSQPPPLSNMWSAWEMSALHWHVLSLFIFPFFYLHYYSYSYSYSYYYYYYFLFLLLLYINAHSIYLSTYCSSSIYFIYLTELVFV